MAARHYEHGQHYEQLVRCYLMQDDYTKMEQLAKLLPDGHQLLKVVTLYGCKNTTLQVKGKVNGISMSEHSALLRMVRFTRLRARQSSLS